MSKSSFYIISKYFVFLLVLLISAKNTFAQSEKGINFFKGTWAEALLEAQKQHKIIFVDMFATWCKPCNEMEKSVFPQEAVGNVFNENFINVRLDAEKHDGENFSEKYIVDAYPSYLFLTESGEIIYRCAGSMSAEKFVKEAEKAIKTAKTDKPLSVLEAEYVAGKRDATFLKEHLVKKFQLLGGDNSALLDEYLVSISESEYHTEKNLSLIAECGTSIGTKAFEILLAADKRRNKLTPQQNKAVLTGITKAQRKAIQKAIDTKDELLLEKTVEIARITAFNPLNAEKDARQIRMKFAKATKNFEFYRQQAKPLTEVLMAKTDEQLAIETTRGLDLVKKNFQIKNRDTTTIEYKNMLEVMENGAAKATSYQLNEISTVFSELTTEKMYLEEALVWSKRALELTETPANYDTNAQILFKLGNKKEAIAQQKNAIKLAKKWEGRTDELEEKLKKMKKS